MPPHPKTRIAIRNQQNKILVLPFPIPHSWGKYQIEPYLLSYTCYHQQEDSWLRYQLDSILNLYRMLSIHLY